MDKPTKPTDLMPRTFGGLKENYSTSLQQTGVEPNIPVIYHGKNFNYEKNAIGQELDYCEKICDFINALPIGKVVTTDSNNKLVYSDLSTDILPDQTGHSGEFLTTDGTTASWSEITGGAEITYADGTTADLEDVVYQTTSTYAGRSSFPKNQMDVVEDIGDNYNPLYFANVKTISASTSYTYSQNGTFCTGSSSVATVTITKSGSSVTIYGNIVRIPRGCTFTSSVAGKFFFDDNYYGYLAS